MVKSASMKGKKPSLSRKKDKNKVLRKQNPFDLKFNRTKHNVLGKSKSTPVGAPMQSKKKALENREKTLAEEFLSIRKTNKMVDKRVGEKDAKMTMEEKESARFVEQRLHSHVSKFALSDLPEEEELTHGGRALTSMEKYDRVEESDDDDDPLTAQLVADAHFGGGEDGGVKKDRKDLLAEIVSRSKAARMEKATKKDDQLELTDSLDSRLNNLLSRGALTKKEGRDPQVKGTSDEYDHLLTSMRTTSDKRGRAVDAKKSEEEEAQDEKKSLEKLERDRLMRMNTQWEWARIRKREMSDDAQKNGAASHLSVDEDVGGKKKKKEEDFELKFDQDGNAIIDHTKVTTSSKRRVHFDSDSDEFDDDSDLDDEGDELDEMMAAIDDEEEDDEDDEICEPVKKKTKEASKEKASASKESVTELPFTLDMPSKYSQLVSLFRQFNVDAIGTIVDRLVTCHHPSLKEGNKALLERLLLFLLRFYTETSHGTPTKENLCVLAALPAPIHKLLKLSREYGVKCMRAMVRGEWRKTVDSPQAPSFSLVAAIRLVSLLFPVSDVWHPVCTPTFILANRSIAKVQVRSLSILARQLVLLSALSEFVDNSHRYIPEAMAFLRGCLCLAVASDGDDITTKKVKEKVEPIRPEEVFASDKSSELRSTAVNRARVLRVVVVLLNKFMVVYSNHKASFTAIFRPLLSLLERIPIDHLPAEMKEEVDVLKTSMKALCDQHAQLIQIGKAKTETGMLAMLEPRIEEDFDPEHKHKWKKGVDAEKKKISHLIKKEKRGAMKEIRKDNAFIAGKRAAEKAALDKDRRLKTKRLMASLATQEGEAKKEESRKKWKKR